MSNGLQKLVQRSSPAGMLRVVKGCLIESNIGLAI